MIEKRFRPDRRFRNSESISRSQYLKVFFERVLNEAALHPDMQYCIVGDFYKGELTDIYDSYNLRPIRVRPSFKQGTFYCHININNISANC